MPYRAGRHFLQIPGPSNVPDRILRAMDQPVIDHRGPEFQALARRVLARIGPVFGTTEPVVIFPSSGTGAWEAALVNTLSPGDRVVMYETGHFATLWSRLAERLGLRPHLLPGDWRGGARADAIAETLAADRAHEIRAVCIVHNETSTGAVLGRARGPGGNRRSRAPGTAHGRYDLGPCQRGAAPRRLGHRRHGLPARRRA